MYFKCNFLAKDKLSADLVLLSMLNRSANYEKLAISGIFRWLAISRLADYRLADYRLADYQFAKSTFLILSKLS